MLRKARVAVSWAVMGLVLYIFTARSPLAVKLSEPVLAFQFAPAAMKAFAGGVAVIGCIVILTATVVFGRVYCACLCPLGILQDVVLVIRRMIAKRVKSLRKACTLRPLPDYRKLRYSILITTIFVTVLGSAALLDLLDPYSLFGRLTTGLLDPPITWVRSVLAGILERFDIYALSEPRTCVVALPILAVTVAFFIGLVALVVWRGRIYCNTVCPVGTLLGLLSNIAPLRVRLNKESCNSCGLCEMRCRSGCIDTTADDPIDVTRCVACFDCLSICRRDAIAYGAKTEAVAVAAEGRRHFILGSVTAAAGVAGLPLSRVASEALSPRDTPVMPPGSLNIEHLSSKCTACHLCVSSCPQHVIKPAFAEYGLRGVMQPVLDFMSGECAYECNVCSQVCPSGAIKPLSLAEKKLVSIGKVRLYRGRCIVYEHERDCGACAEVCPTHAVYTVEKRGVLFPETRSEPCIGCGACQHVCPLMPKAILVHSLAVHEKAEAPFANEPKSTTVSMPEGMDDFPF